MYGLKTALAAATVSLAGVAAAGLPSGTAQAASPSFCANYARDAINKQRTNLRRRCNFRGSRWQLNYRNHFRWCLQSTSATVNREARARNAQLRNCRRPRACPRIYRPVCGVVRGQRRTYSNSCVARNAGARIVAQGQCRTGPVFCPAIYKPVCGVKNGRRQTFSNLCVARRNGATGIRNGRCPTQGACTREYRPVCGYKNGQPRTYSNLCVARRAGARHIRSGQCRPQGGGRDKACAIQIKKKLRIIAGIRRKGCAMPRSADYSTNQQTQLRLCRARAPRQRAGILANMDGYRFKCRPQGGTPGGGQAAKQRACNAYANSALAQRARYWSMGCSNDTSSTWSSNRSAHYNYCMRVGPGPAAGLTRHRQGQIQACSRN